MRPPALTPPILPRLDQQVTQQAQTGELGPDAVMEGGDTDSERRCTFLELALSLAGGLDGSGLETLYKAAKPGILVSGVVTVVVAGGWPWWSGRAGWRRCTRRPSRASLWVGGYGWLPCVSGPVGGVSG